MYLQVWNRETPTKKWKNAVRNNKKQSYSYISHICSSIMYVAWMLFSSTVEATWETKLPVNTTKVLCNGSGM